MSRLAAVAFLLGLAFAPAIGAQDAPQQFNPCNPKIQKCA